MNERTPDTPPIIAPRAPGETSQLWSVMIPCYNCSVFLKETIESVLANDEGAGRMQIEVVDDYSTDADVEALVKEVGKGRISFFRQEKNVGSLRNFETCINRATGEWIHILHGDDKISKGFYREVESLFVAHPEAGAAFTGVSCINEKGDSVAVKNLLPASRGIIKDWLLQIARTNLVQPPAMVVKRKVYERLGSFFAVHYGEDWEMWVRIAANFPVAYSPKQLAVYRFLRIDSISSSSVRSGQNGKDLLKVINIIQDYLPEDQRKKLKKEARRNFSRYYVNYAQLLYNNNNSRAAIRQAKVAIRLYFNKKTIFSLLKIYVKTCIDFFSGKGVLKSMR